MLFPFVSLIVWLLVPGASLANSSPNCSSDALESPVCGSDGALYATSCEFQLAKQQHPLIEKANLTLCMKQRKSKEIHPSPWSRKLLKVARPNRVFIQIPDDQPIKLKTCHSPKFFFYVCNIQ